jgi:hypothetical protein
MPVRLLILSAYRTLQGFQELQAGRHLLAALAARGVEHELRRPWLPQDGLEAFDVVLCWTYRHTWHNFLYWAGEVERRCTGLGIPVINSARRFTYLHSPDLAAWTRQGVRCARHQRFASPARLDLRYPLVLRRDSEHRGRRMYLVGDPAEAAAAFAEDLAAAGPRMRLDLAVEFVDTRWPDGFYRKRRAYVVGGEVIPAHSVRSEHWLVNFASRAGNLGSYKEDRRFLDEGEERADLVRQAAAALEADFAAIDYSPAPDGGRVFWEANRNPRMWGDRELAAGKPRAADRRFGEALAELVLRRAAAGRGGGGGGDGGPGVAGAGGGAGGSGATGSSAGRGASGA